MTKFDDPAVLEAIRTAVQKAERGTRAEIVPVIALRADDYRFIPMLYAMTLALILPMPFLGFGLDWPFDAIGLFEGQLVVAIGVSFIVQFTPLRYRLIPRPIRHMRAARMAREQFVEQRVHMTEGHYGVLLFVAVAERYVEVLVDEGLAAHTDSAEWQKAIDDFTRAVSQGRIAEGFEAAISDIGAVLAQHVPAPDDNDNELPDRLVVIG